MSVWREKRGKREASAGLPTILVLLLNAYAYMHFWQNNPKLWKWNWLSLASLFTITDYSGILRNAEVSQSWLPAIMCLPFHPMNVVDDLWGISLPLHVKRSPPALLNRAWCQRKGIKLSGVSIFVPTYRLSKAAQVLPQLRRKPPSDSTATLMASWGRRLTGTPGSRVRDPRFYLGSH